MLGWVYGYAGHVRGREEVQVLSNVPIVRCQHAFERAGCTTIVTTGQLTPHRQWECEYPLRYLE